MSRYNGCFMRKRKKLKERNINKYGKLTCEYCGKANLKPGNGIDHTLDNSTVDHFIPISKGGDNSWKNLYITCAECNWNKADKHPKEFKETYFNKQLNSLVNGL